MTRPQIQLLVLAFATMAAAGWSVGGNSAKHPASAAGESAVPRERSERPERRSRAVAAPTGEAAERLAAIRATRDPLERNRATIALANTLSIAEFAAWLDGEWFRQRGEADATLFRAILIERWRNEDPEGLLAWSFKNGNDDADPVVSEWVETQPQRLLDFFKLHPDPEAELRVLAKIAEKNPDLAFQRFQQMAAAGISEDASYYLREVLEEIVKQSPAALEAVLDSLPTAVKFQAEVKLIGLKMKTAPSEEFAKLLARPDGLALYRELHGNDATLNIKILDELANLPPSWLAAIKSSPDSFMDAASGAGWVTADWVEKGFSEEEAVKIRHEAIDFLKRYNPADAIRLMGEAGLNDEERRSLVSHIFSGEDADSDKMAELMALLPSDDFRKIAREEMEDKPDTGEPETSPIKTPADWLAAMANLDENTLPSIYYRLRIQAWDADQQAVLARQFEALPDAAKKKFVQMTLDSPFGGMPVLYAESVRYLVSHPEMIPPPAEPSDPFADRIDPVTLSSRYVGHLSLENPEQAAEWIHSLPDGEAKLWASKNLKSVWSQYDPAASEQWFNSLPANMRSQVRGLKVKNEE